MSLFLASKSNTKWLKSSKNQIMLKKRTYTSFPVSESMGHESAKNT